MPVSNQNICSHCVSPVQGIQWAQKVRYTHIAGGVFRFFWGGPKDQGAKCGEWAIRDIFYLHNDNTSYSTGANVGSGRGGEGEGHPQPAITQTHPLPFPLPCHPHQPTITVGVGRVAESGWGEQKQWRTK